MEFIKFDPRFNRLMANLKRGLPKMMELEGLGNSLDPDNFTEGYLGAHTTADASVDPNSNVTDKNTIGYRFEFPKAYMKLYSLQKLWRKMKELYNYEDAGYAVEKHINGDMYIHDAYTIGMYMPYCFNFSTYDIMVKGLPMITKIKSVPPKHFYSFKSQVEQFSLIAGNTVAGAVGLADFLLVSSYYIEKALKNKADAHFKFETEEDVWMYVKETFASFIYTMNQPTRASQSIFSNISVYDRTNLEELEQDYIFPNGQPLNIDLIEEIQNVFLDVMNETMSRTPTTFPVTTACFATDENFEIADKKFVNDIAEKSVPFGFINMFNGATSTLSSCCRLRSATDHEFFNSFGAGKSKIGSIGVVSLNLPRYAVEALRHPFPLDVFVEKALKHLRLGAKVNNAKRMLISDAIDAGIHPLYTHGFMELEKQYSTTGINGLYEALEILGLDITSKEGLKYTNKFMDTLNEEINRCEIAYGFPHNIEQVPAENMAVKVAKKDRIAKYQDKYEIYSNQFIPLTKKVDALDRIQLQGELDEHFSGGSVLHLNIDQKLNKEQIEKLIKECAKHKVAYWAPNYVLKECSEGHMTAGQGEVCSICGAPIVNEYTRVVGFFVNKENFSKERREHDYPERKWYSPEGVDVNEHSEHAI